MREEFDVLGGRFSARRNCALRRSVRQELIDGGALLSRLFQQVVEPQRADGQTGSWQPRLDSSAGIEAVTADDWAVLPATAARLA